MNAPEEADELELAGIDPASIELFRHACEVREIVKRFDAIEREEYFRGVARNRGDLAAQRLRNDVTAEIERRREAARRFGQPGR